MEKKIGFFFFSVSSVVGWFAVKYIHHRGNGGKRRKPLTPFSVSLCVLFGWLDLLGKKFTTEATEINREKP